MDDLLKKLESEKENRFKKPWPKLENGNKLMIGFPLAFKPASGMLYDLNE